MQLKTFHAPSVREAMAQVRAVLGEDAIIISTIRGRRGQGVQITAAKELPPDRNRATPMPAEEPSNIGTVAEALRFHSVSPMLAERLTKASDDINEKDWAVALADAINASFSFSPLAIEPSRPIMLVGLPGAGKTVTTAKLAARTTLAGATVGVITTDYVRAGGVEQLTAFTDILSARVIVVETVEAAKKALEELDSCNAVFVDTPGTNPFDCRATDNLHTFVEVLNAEPVMVVAAGGDTLEMADAAEVFAGLGVRRFMTTRLDIARRLGSLLDIADRTGMALADVSATPFIAQGLQTLNPISFARLLRQAAFSASDNFTALPVAERVSQ